MVYDAIIRVLIIILSSFLFIVTNPFKWKLGASALLQDAPFKRLTHTYIGVVDRIEYYQAVILLDGKKSELTFHINKLPIHCSVGTWFLVNEYSDGTYSIIVQEELTKKNKSKSNHL